MICQEWVAGAMATLEAEFPAWHLVGCFDVFHLKGSKTTQKRGACTDDALKKLAQVFAVDYKDLSSQYISIFANSCGFAKEKWFGQPFCLGPSFATLGRSLRLSPKISSRSS